MRSDKFWNLVMINLSPLPFKFNDIKCIDGNVGTIWIDTNDGKTYSISIQELEE